MKPSDPFPSATAFFAAAATRNECKR